MATIQNKVVDKFIVAQHNDLVEANYSSKLTARALKVGRFIISKINPSSKDFSSLEFSIIELKHYLGYKENVTWGRFHADIKDVCKRLNKEPMEISSKKGVLEGFFLISYYKIDIPEGKVTFDISPKLMPYLLLLQKNFTGYCLTNIPKLKSSYSIRIYELLHQYRKIGKRHFEINDLQKKVGSNYKLYGDFKRKVIKQAQKDVKKYTDLAFVFDEIKTGKKVTAIEFIIFGNKPEQKKSPQLSFLENVIAIEDKGEEEKPAFSEKVIEVLNKLGISEQNIAKYLAKGFEIIQDTSKRKEVIKRCETLENYYLEKLELLKNSPSAQSNNNGAGFLVQALKEDWTSSNALKKQKENIYAKELSNAKKQYQKITRNIGVLDKKRKELEATTIKGLLEDKDLLETAYNDAISGIGDFMKKHIMSSDGSTIFSLPIEKQYEKSFQIRIYTNIKLRELRSENFAEISKMETQKAKLETKADELKKKYLL